MKSIVFLVVTLLEMASSPSFAGYNANGTILASLSKFKAIYFTILFIIFLLYKNLKKTKDTYSEAERLHAKELDELRSLRKKLDNIIEKLGLEADDCKLMIECPSCTTTNLLHETFCRECKKYISLESLRKRYHEDILYLELISNSSKE